MGARVLWALNAPENSSFAPPRSFPRPPAITIPPACVAQKGERVEGRGVDNYYYSLSTLYTEQRGEGFVKGSTHGYAETKPPLKMIKAKSVRQSCVFFSFSSSPPSRVFKCHCFRSVQMHACMHACPATPFPQLSRVLFSYVRTPFPVPIPYLSFHSRQKIPLRVNSTSQRFIF